MLQLYSIGRLSCVCIFFKHKVTLKFLLLRNPETQARLVQIHQVTNKLPDPKVSVAIKKVLGALVWVEWEKGFFLSLEAVSPGGLSGEVGVRNSAISQRLCETQMSGFRQVSGPQEDGLTYFESPI